MSRWLRFLFFFVVHICQGEGMIVIGHRGACGYEPENTFVSFKKALALGVDFIEFDVRKTRDDKLVIMHDATVNRTTNGLGEVAQMTYAQLSKLDAGDSQKIPMLHEVLDLVDKKVIVNIEIKAPEAVQGIAHVIKEYIEKKGWKNNNFLVSSFDINALHELHELMPDIPVMPIFSKLPKNWMEVAKDFSAKLISISYKTISEDAIKKAHEHDLKIVVYTVNEPKEIDEMKKLGVDGICSNYPDRVK